MANTLASGASARKGLEVQLLSWASHTNRSVARLACSFLHFNPVFDTCSTQGIFERTDAAKNIYSSVNYSLAFGVRLCYHSPIPQPFVPIIEVYAVPQSYHKTCHKS